MKIILQATATKIEQNIEQVEEYPINADAVIIDQSGAFKVYNMLTSEESKKALTRKKNEIAEAMLIREKALEEGDLSCVLEIDYKIMCLKELIKQIEYYSNHCHFFHNNLPIEKQKEGQSPARIFFHMAYFAETGNASILIGKKGCISISIILPLIENIKNKQLKSIIGFLKSFNNQIEFDIFEVMFLENSDNINTELNGISIDELIEILSGELHRRVAELPVMVRERKLIN